MTKAITRKERKERLDAALTNYHVAYSKYRESIETLLPIGAIVNVRIGGENLIARITDWGVDRLSVHIEVVCDGTRFVPRVGAIVEILEVPQ